MNRVYIKKGRDESIKRFHPWIFSGAIAKIVGEPYEGEVVEVFSYDEQFLAYGHFQKGSITVRILSYNRDERPENGAMTLAFWVDRLSKAKSMRTVLGLPESKTDCYRLVHGEGDSLPGLIIDIYGKTAVIQAHSAGMFLSLEVITEALKVCFGEDLASIYDKSEGTAPFKAGLNLGDKYLWGKPSENESVVLENGNKFSVNWKEGQKTGFFLDQRDNRALVGEYARGKNVLNMFCYTGGFSIYALNNGAKSVVSVDSSAKAIEMVEKNVAINFPEGNMNHTSVCTDALDYIKEIPKGKFDMIIVDPPAFAKHRGALDNALRAYRRLNANAIEKVAPGGLVFTYSCSQVVDKQAFALAVFSAAAQTGRKVKILRRLTQPADHPVNIYHPEGEYLKGLLLYVE
ncbi:MAG: class I SAM-dependent rRNA methyltransferase [Bacteroidales bacterium]|nr:class I SAM-dependent rRNA methyltransferase [Bacteroidales bacterium]